MARARLLKPGFFNNEELCELPMAARLLFAGLWTIADKRGRMDDRPKRIKAAVFPFDNVNVPKMLDALEEKGFIQRYTVAEAHFIQVTNFDKHQHPHMREPESSIPGPVPALDQHGAATAFSGSSPSEAEAEADNGNQITVAEAETAKTARALTFNPTTEPFIQDEPGYPGEFFRHWQRKHGRDPSGSMMADAAQMERLYGFDASMQVSQDTGWEKPPTWMIQKLEQRKRDAESGVAVGARRRSLLYEDRE